jgi:hypothetical protein
MTIYLILRKHLDLSEFWRFPKPGFSMTQDEGYGFDDENRVSLAD